MNHNMKHGLRKYLLLGLLAMLASVSLSAATVYFKNTSNWSNVYIYTWGGSCNISGWPGVQMTNTGTDNIYSYETGCDNVGKVIFNCGSNSCQTGDLSWDASKPLYVYNSGWQEYTAPSVPCLAIHSNIQSSSNNWSPVKMIKSEDETTASCTITISSPSTGKEFGIRKLTSCESDNQAEWWNVASGTTITSSNCTNIPFGKNRGSNAKINMTVAGSYVFTWNYASSTLTVTYPVPAVTYTVTFNANGHGTAPAAQTVESGSKATEPTAPVADGYMFGGWYKESSCTNKWDFSTAVTSDITLYAKWTEVSSSAYTYYYYNRYGWNPVQAHIWNKTGNTTTNLTGDWPGGQMTAVENHAGWYSITFSSSLAPTHVLFHSGDTKESFDASDQPIDTDPTFVYYNSEIAKETGHQSYWHDSFGDDPYPITFGVVDNIGGEITAVSDGSTVYPGSSVTSVTFTAQPATGYTVEGWYSDAAGLVQITAAGTNTAYTLARVTATDNTVYVKFKQSRMVYLKPNDCNAWNDKYVYTFGNTPWDNTKGVHPKNNRIEYGNMQRVNDSVYAYALTNSQTFSYIAFNSADQSGYDDFYSCEAIFRADHKETLQMFVSERGGVTKSVNQTTYRSSGIWMRYNATDAGYKLVLTNTATNATDKTYFTTSTQGAFSFSLTESLVQGVSYTFYVENDNGDMFSRGSDVGNILTGETVNYLLYQWKSGNPAGITFTPAITGEYTFNLHLSDGKVIIDVLFPTTEYRLVYVEQEGSVVKKFHPSHSVRQRTDATAESPLRDTVSLHVRPYVKNAGMETANPLNCEVWLQEYETDGNTMQWRTIGTSDVKAMPQITGNGVYNFVIRQDGAVALAQEETEKYDGNYFIRSDASKAGWDYVSAKSHLQNRFWYSDYARQHEDFDHYCCHWTTAGTNLNFVVANDYSYCLTDTLVQSAYEKDNGFVDATGKLDKDANIRFMWNSYDNSTDRAFLAGAGNNLQLLSEKGIYDTGGTQRTEMQFADQQNWVYRLDVKADPNTHVKIKAPYANVNQYFKGKEGDFSDENTFLFIEGTSGNSYNIRVIYDFKTNHLICAWIPDGEITSDETIQTDLMIIRENHGEARQLVFNPNELTIGEVNNAYCVLTLTKEYLESSASSKEKTVYWVSFPFDVRLSEVFGCGTYGVDYAIQYYDGAARAQNGCWSDSPTYWKHYWETNGVILEKGKGYVVDIDWVKIKNEQFAHNNRDVSIYFPSANTEPMTISGTVESIDYPEHKCTIERDDRYIYDSNWNLMGVPSYANLDEFGNPMPAQQIGKHKVGFLYEYDPATSSFTASEADKVKFFSMRSYLVQFAGEMDWENPTMQGVLPNQSIARKSVAASDNDGNHTVCLALKQAGNMLDRTYLRLQDDEATSAFDMNIDLTKQNKVGANIYSLTLGDNIRVAANVLPASENVTIPLGVVVAEDGIYTLALPDGTDGLEVVLVDYQDNMRTNLLFGDYVVNLTKGTFEKRFALEVNNRRVITNTMAGTDEHDAVTKYMIDGDLFIRCGANVYDALGRICK